jgi:hypothetical protein
VLETPAYAKANPSKINLESAKALRQTSVRDSLTGEGAEVVGGTPASAK